MILDCGSVVFATTFGRSLVGTDSAVAAFSTAAASALRTTPRALAIRVLSSIGTGGRPIGFLPAAIRAA